MGYLDACHEIEELSGGKRRLTAHLRPVAYRRDGVLRAIARDWVDSGIAERPHLVTDAPMMVTVAEDGMRRIHPTRELDRYMELGAPYVRVGGVWQKAPLGAPERSANLLTWTATNANMYVAHGGHFIKLGILLKNGWVPANRQFAFPIGLTGLTRAGGQVYADGAPVMRVRQPFVTDLDNSHGVELPIEHQFVQLSGQWYVLFTLPEAVASMGRPFIDPTLESQPDASAGLDTFISSGDVDNNNGVNQALWAGGSGAASDVTTRTQLKFDLSSIIGGGYTIDSAEIELVAIEGANADLSIYRALTQWYEGDGNNSAPSGDGSTWNYRNDNGSVAWAGGAGGAAGSDWAATATDTQTSVSSVFTLDVAADVQDFADETYTDYGWWLRVPAWEAPEDWSVCRMYSSDTGTASYRPKITVVYTEGGGATGSPWYAYAQQ